MSNGTVNLHKSFTYLQPDEYRFSHDSVFLAREVFEIATKEKMAVSHVLDLCAGCGIVGLDFAFHLYQETSSQIEKLDFLEIQKIYEPYLQKNILNFSVETGKVLNTGIFIENYANVPSLTAVENHYELILCNPPYFRITQGKLSPSEFKNRCRFFIDASFSELLSSVNFLLKPGGSAFILVQSLHDHKIDPLKELGHFPNLLIKPRGQIRSTGLFQITKLEKITHALKA
jgi:tRNA1(Val) A37 N6-methylase TrmN6